MSAGTRTLAAEVPVALAYNGLSYAVVMATPANLLDFAVGFTVSEGLAPADALGIGEIAPVVSGFVIRLRVPPSAERRLRERRRAITSVTACGLCGVAEVTEAVRPLPQVPTGPRVSLAAIHQAMTTLRAAQPLNEVTGAVHAAAWLPAQAVAVTEVREDVGRHTALDKLIGARLRAGADLGQGAVLMTSRCSLELVQKAATAGVRVLVTVSAPTALAVAQAQAAGLALVALARADAMLVMTDPHGALDGASARG